MQTIAQGADAGSGATTFITPVNDALDTIPQNWASLGVSQSQLDSTVPNLAKAVKNASAA